MNPVKSHMLEMSSNYNFSKVPKLYEEIANNKKLLPYHNKADKRLTDIQKSISQASFVILQMPIAVRQCQQQPFEPKTFVSLVIGT